MYRRAMLVDAGRMRAGNREHRAQAGNQCEYDGDSQFHIPSIAADRTREHDARIHDFVVWPLRDALQNRRKTIAQD
jgi:hypothetical protein